MWNAVMRMTYGHIAVYVRAGPRLRRLDRQSFRGSRSTWWAKKDIGIESIIIQVHALHHLLLKLIQYFCSIINDHPGLDKYHQACAASPNREVNARMCPGRDNHVQ